MKCVKCGRAKMLVELQRVVPSLSACKLDRYVSSGTYVCSSKSGCKRRQKRLEQLK